MGVSQSTFKAIKSEVIRFPRSVTLCLENNILVMVIALNFIPDRRSSKNCMVTVPLLTV